MLVQFEEKDSEDPQQWSNAKKWQIVSSVCFSTLQSHNKLEKASEKEPNLERSGKWIIEKVISDFRFFILLLVDSDDITVFHDDVYRFEYFCLFSWNC